MSVGGNCTEFVEWIVDAMQKVGECSTLFLWSMSTRGKESQMALRAGPGVVVERGVERSRRQGEGWIVQAPVSCNLLSMLLLFVDASRF